MEILCLPSEWLLNHRCDRGWDSGSKIFRKLTCDSSVQPELRATGLK